MLMPPPDATLTYFHLYVPEFLYGKARQHAQQNGLSVAASLSQSLQLGVEQSQLTSMEQRLTCPRATPPKSDRQRKREQAAWVSEQKHYETQGVWHCTLRLPPHVDHRLGSLAFAEGVRPGVMASRLLREGWEHLLSHPESIAA